MVKYPYSKQQVIANVQSLKKTQISILYSIASRDRLRCEEQLQFYTEARKLPWWNIKRYFAVSPDLEYLENLNRLISDLEEENLLYEICWRYPDLNSHERYSHWIKRLEDTAKMEKNLYNYSGDEVILSEEELQRYMK